jgi:uncharacterized hydrophobic protein (TIGR00341 family)
MALRLIEIYHEKGMAKEIDFLLKDTTVLDMWHDQLPEGETITKVLLKAKNTDKVLDILQSFFAMDKKLRVVIMPVEATIPRPETEGDEDTEKEKDKSPDRISMEELYQKMMRGSGLSRNYMVMVVIASFVAAIGLMNNDVAVIIGSMVISPLLGPNEALALATTLGDYKLARKSLITNLTGFSAVFLISWIMGLLMEVDPSVPQIASRSDVSHYYIFIALATGVAGAYSKTTGVVEALVGVMVAVALLPPLVVSGLLFGSGLWIGAAGAFLLFMVNVVCINLAGVGTFIFQGIRPKDWWEAKKAKRAVRIAVTVWIALLILLIFMIFIEQKIMTVVN